VIESGDSLLAAEHFHGPLSQYLDAGFRVLGQNMRLTVARKLLASPA
jgi:hypothetical protein